MPARAVCPRRCAPRPWTCARPWSARDRGHGPISVHDKMASMGLKAPSPAWLARLFRREGVARAEPSKRPRAAWRRFVYPAPNACWQLDATEYVLAGGRKAVIFQLQDDHSRLAVASLVAPGETSQAAIDVFDRGVAARGVHPAPADRQRRGPQPQPARSHRPPGGARALPGRRTHHRQTPPPHHPGQERALPPDPVPLPGPAAPGRLHRRAPGAGRPLRPHPATPSAPTRACPGASPRSRPGTPPRSPRRPDRATTPAPSPRRARPPNPTPPTGPGCAGAGPSPPAASAN
jgi:hypothetical protein